PLRRGVGVGDAAALLLYNRPEYLAFFWACLAIGAAPVAINYRYRAAEVRELLEDSDARVLLVPTSLGAIAVEAATGLDVEIIAIDDDGTALPRVMPYDAVLAEGGALPPEAPRGAELRLYTGGTTGRPRAVVWDMDTLLVARRQSTWGIL